MERSEWRHEEHTGRANPCGDHAGAHCVPGDVREFARGSADPGQETQHRRDHGRRRRRLERQRLPPRNDGRQHAQHRPHRQGGRTVHGLLRPAVLHGRSGRVHPRPDTVSHRAAEGRSAGGQAGPAGQGPDHRRAPEAAWLCHRPDRQEPSWRPQRVPADGARIRRVLRHPLSPQRDGRAVPGGLSEGSEIQGDVRAAQHRRFEGEQH